MTPDAQDIPAEKLFRASNLPCEIRHPMILHLWERLQPGDYFVLINDHDPLPLRSQFQRRFPECFNWEYLERGPTEFRIRITRLRSS